MPVQPESTGARRELSAERWEQERFLFEKSCMDQPTCLGGCRDVLDIYFLEYGLAQIDGHRRVRREVENISVNLENTLVLEGPGLRSQSLADLVSRRSSEST